MQDKKILRQVEFYFGDANLNRDKWLRNELHNSEGYYFPIDKLMSFNKIKALTTDTQEVLDAVKQSNLVEINSDETSIRRKMPYKRKNRFDAAQTSVFVEQLPLDMTVEDIEDMFSKYGVVRYVKVRKTKGKFNGTAFVEFKTVNSARQVSDLMDNATYFLDWLNNVRTQK